MAMTLASRLSPAAQTGAPGPAGVIELSGDRRDSPYAGAVSSPGDLTKGTPETPQPRITLIGKPGCHLCDDARDVVSRVAEETGAGWRELSILDHPQLAERYAEEIPVVLVDGAEHDFWRVDERRLRDALAGRRRWFASGRRRS
jgi:hypothetical protein